MLMFREAAGVGESDRLYGFQLLRRTGHYVGRKGHSLQTSFVFKDELMRGHLAVAKKVKSGVCFARKISGTIAESSGMKGGKRKY